MTKLFVRFALLAVFGVALAGAAGLIAIDQRHAVSIDASTRRFDALVHSLTIGSGDLRAAEQAYVAAGQGQDFWFARVSSTMTAISAELSDLKAAATSADAAAAIDEGITHLQDLAQVDARVRDLLRMHQITGASDLIFADGFDLTQKIAGAVDRASTAENVAADLALGGLRRRQAAAAGAAALVGLLVAVLLVSVPARAAIPAAPMAPAVSTETLDDLSNFGRTPDAGASAPAQPSIDLQEMAAICGDLSRLTERRSLPALLERASRVLDANGIVLWIADPDGRELAPIVIQGYPPTLANRMGTLKRDAENLTASAFRTGLLQAVKGDTLSNGAIAVPLVTPAGCVGVIAAELKNGGEQQPALLAAATILASQLATLVGPPAIRKAEATG